MRFCKKGNSSHKYVVPYKILKILCKVACELGSQPEQAPMHPVFHFLLLKKFVDDPASIVPSRNVAMSYEG